MIKPQSSKDFIGFALLLEDVSLLDAAHQVLNAQIRNAPKFTRGWAELAAFYNRNDSSEVVEQVFQKGLQKCRFEDILESISDIRCG
ncbi:MAG: hypothetical protein GF309_07955 [Candidatus Lokiarchaeota archaeon]|nr:hypothetical protein [Candidatus Lokiarchaeota archaeon]